MAEVLDDEDEFTCWCGAKGAYEDLCDLTALEEGCGGTGTIHCYCGGDQCVCHNHGSMDCDGCEDCGQDVDDDYEDSDLYYDPDEHDDWGDRD